MRYNSRRCPQCLIPQTFCVCQVVAAEAVPTRVTVVVHFSDVTRTTNTGKWVPIVLANSELLIRGAKEAPLDIARAVSTGYHNLLLYPSTDSEPLTADYLSAIRQPVNLIVPDGNWNQAGKMVRREKRLQAIPRVHLIIDKPSRYRLRTAAHDNWVSTFEATARALGVIENGDLQNRLEHFFDVAVERVLYLKGQLPREQVTGGITPEMIRQFHTDNEDRVFIEALARRLRKK